MLLHSVILSGGLGRLIRRKEICLAGNRRLKIYGTLSCRSGKKMKKENRVFFINEEEAIREGYRPCGHCMKQAYLMSKNRVETGSHKSEI